MPPACRTLGCSWDVLLQPELLVLRQWVSPWGGGELALLLAMNNLQALREGSGETHAPH